MAHKAFKYRIYPTEEQQEFMNKSFGCVRFVYNYYLDIRKSAYEKEKRTVNYYECQRDLTQMKKENTFLQEVDSSALTYSLRHLDAAYSNFFKVKASAYPKFKSKRASHKSYTIPFQGMMGDMIRLRKAGAVRMNVHRPIPEGYIPKSCTVSQDPDGKYYVSIGCAYVENIQEKELSEENSITLHFSDTDLYVDDNGNYAGMPKFYDLSYSRMIRAQKVLSKKQEGSNNYEKIRVRLAKIHKHIANQRRDFIQKRTTELANTYDYIYIDDVSVKKLLAKEKDDEKRQAILDNAWCDFVTILTYKMHDRGKKLILLEKEPDETEENEETTEITEQEAA